MSFTTALYEGDGIIHRAPRVRAPARSRPAGIRRAAPAPIAPLPDVMDVADLATAEREGWGVAIATVWNALRSLFLWMEAKSREANYLRVEAYLAQSCNHADLERRMRELERCDRLNWIDCCSR